MKTFRHPYVSLLGKLYKGRIKQKSKTKEKGDKHTRDVSEKDKKGKSPSAGEGSSQAGGPRKVERAAGPLGRVRRLREQLLQQDEMNWMRGKSEYLHRRVKRSKGID